MELQQPQQMCCNLITTKSYFQNQLNKIFFVIFLSTTSWNLWFNEWSFWLIYNFLGGGIGSIFRCLNKTGLKLENYYFFTFTFSRPEVRKLLLFYVFTFSRPEVRKLLLFYVFTFSRPEVGKLLLFYVFTFSRPEVRKLLLFYVFTFSRPEVGKLLLFTLFLDLKLEYYSVFTFLLFLDLKLEYYSVFTFLLFLDLQDCSNSSELAMGLLQSCRSRKSKNVNTE